LAEAMHYSLLSPGKRLRPLLVLLAARACGGDEQKAMPAACAVEMVHAYSLIHDDLPAMDDDDLRRGRPTCHKVYGEAMAILAGDAILALAFETLTGMNGSPAVVVECCRTLAHAAGCERLVGGQADDMALGDGDSSVERIESIHGRKTGALIGASLRLGGLAADAGAAQLDSLAEYGWRIGLLFQIIDDLLDVRGDAAALGKRVGKDSDRGKLTFPAVLGVDGSMDRAEQLTAEACDALRPLPERELLASLARYILERNH